MTAFEILSLVAGLLSTGGLFGVIFFGGRFVGRIEGSIALSTTATVGLQAAVQSQGERLVKVESDLTLIKNSNEHHMNSFHRELARRVDETSETATEARVLARLASAHDWDVTEGKPR